MPLGGYMSLPPPVRYWKKPIRLKVSLVYPLGNEPIGPSRFRLRKTSSSSIRLPELSRSATLTISPALLKVIPRVIGSPQGRPGGKMRSLPLQGGGQVGDGDPWHRRYPSPPRPLKGRESFFSGRSALIRSFFACRKLLFVVYPRILVGEGNPRNYPRNLRLLLFLHP